MYRYKIGISEQQHDDFLRCHPQVNLLQSSDWAKIKANWANERIGFYKDEELVAVASVLIKKLPLGFTMLYIPRGPIMDYLDQGLVTYVLASLKAFAKQQKAFYIKFDPLVLLGSGLTGQEWVEEPSGWQTITNLKAAGAMWTGLTKVGAATIQPRLQANIHSNYFSDAVLSKSTRQAIRTARNKGLKVQFGEMDLLDDFAALMRKTEDRKHIQLRDQSYYEKLLVTYAGKSYITMSYLDLSERVADLEVQLTKARQDLAKVSDQTKPTKIDQLHQTIERLEEERSFLAEKQLQGLDRVPLSGTLSVEFGQTSEVIYAGMDEEYRCYQPAILTWYHTALHAFERGMVWQNLGGVENTLDGGLFGFKSKFHPVIEELIGEFNLPVSPLYRLSDKVYRLRKKLRSKL